MTKCSMIIMSTCLDAAHEKIKYTFKSTYKLDWFYTVLAVFQSFGIRRNRFLLLSTNAPHKKFTWRQRLADL